MRWIDDQTRLQAIGELRHDGTDEECIQATLGEYLVQKRDKRRAHSHKLLSSHSPRGKNGEEKLENAFYDLSRL